MAFRLLLWPRMPCARTRVCRRPSMHPRACTDSPSGALAAGLLTRYPRLQRAIEKDAWGHQAPDQRRAVRASGGCKGSGARELIQSASQSCVRPWGDAYVISSSAKSLSHGPATCAQAAQAQSPAVPTHAPLMAPKMLMKTGLKNSSELAAVRDGRTRVLQ